LALFNAGRAEESERETRRALRINAGAAEAHTLLGVILASRGTANAEAADALSQAAALNPNSFDAHFYLGRVLYALGDHAGAVKELRAAAALDPRLALGRADALAGRYADAVVQLQAATALAPYRSDAHYQLGLALRRLGRDEEAKREFDAVDKLNTEFRTGATTRQ